MKAKKVIKRVGIAVAVPIALFLLLAVLIYLPPVQRFAIDRIAASLSESLGMRVSVDKVRLAFPLDLALHGVLAENGRDTLIDARSMKLGVEMLPLLRGVGNVNELAIYDTKLNTMSLISDTRVSGIVGAIEIKAHGADWRNEVLTVQSAVLDKSDILVQLSDTAAEDTTESKPVKWRISAQSLRITSSSVMVQMPGDSMRVMAYLGDARLNGGLADIASGSYSAKTFVLRGSRMAYDLPYVERAASGFDASHIYADSISARIDSFAYSADGRLNFVASGMAMRERSGLVISDASTRYAMDSTSLSVSDAVIATGTARLRGSLQADLTAFTPGAGGSMSGSVEGSMGKADWLPFAALPDTMARAIPDRNISLRGSFTGNIDRLRVSSLRAEMPGVAVINLSGDLSQIAESDRYGTMLYTIAVSDATPLVPLVRVAAGESVSLPSWLVASGSVNFAGDTYGFTTNGSVDGGKITAQGSYNVSSNAFKLTSTAGAFPLQRFVPDAGLNRFSGSVALSGNGFDYFSAGSRLNADVRIDKFCYADYDLDRLSLKGSLEKGVAHFDFDSDNEYVQGKGTIDATFANKTVSGHIAGNVPMINLMRFGFITDSVIIGTDLDVDFSSDSKYIAMSAKGGLSNIRIQTPKQSLLTDDLMLEILTDKDTTDATIGTGDLSVHLSSFGSITKLSDRMGKLADFIVAQVSNKRLDRESLSRELPKMDVSVVSGKDNLLSHYLTYRGISYNSVFFNMSLDPRDGMVGVGQIDSLQTGSLMLDKTNFTLQQDSTGIHVEANIDNTSKKNPHRFTAQMQGELRETGFVANAIYRDSKEREGLRVGVEGEVSDSGFTAKFYPERPVIAYRQFSINEDNYIFIGSDRTIRANVDLLADDGTGLQLYHTPGKENTNDLTLGMKNFNLGELSQMLPYYMPPISGLLTGDFHIVRELDSDTYTASVAAAVANLGYDGVNLGKLVSVEGVMIPQSNGQYVNAVINRDGSQVGLVDGMYFSEEEGRFKGTLDLEKFPLAMANGFMEGTDFELAGSATGTLNLDGPVASPIIDGSLAVDSMHVISPVYGIDLAMGQRTLSFDKSKLEFDNVKFFADNTDNSLTVSGNVDMTNLSDVALNLNLKAENYLLINSARTSKSTVYGKLYADFEGRLSGRVSNLSMRGRLTVLDDTNVGYVMSDNLLVSGTNLSDLVTFVSFDDSVEVAETPMPTNISVNLGITVNTGANVYCDLGDGESYLDMEGGGTMTFRYISGEMLLVGRYTIYSGQMKYAMPVIPLKTFTIASGSYVDFTGDVMNPTLNIAATEKTRASVTTDNSSQSVDFEVGLKLTNNLENLGLTFTIDAPGNMTVKNTLASMGEAERAKVAVTMLATGMYIGDGSSGSLNASSALNAFLQSEIQSIAGNALKSVDITFGMESGTSSTGEAQTDYTFQFSKRFWGDRLTVIIGGSISSGNSTSTTSNNSFIDNVSLQYRLDKSGTRYVTVFYDRDSQDPLEGSYSVMGASLVLRRRTNNLGELFIFRRNKKKASADAPSITSSQ